jgi:glycosyltransferase involved in cell wall biosynthesis
MAKETRKKILFVTPGASTAGGNVFLFNFLKWFKKNCEIPFITVCGHGGELEAEFAELSETFIYSLRWQPENYVGRGIHGLLRRSAVKERWIRRRIESENVGLVYNNTVINHRIIDDLQNLKAPILTHCHELESVIRRTGLEGFERTKNKTGRFIAVSDAVRRNLVENHRVEREKISLVHGFIPVQNWSAETIAEKRRRVLDELNIPPDAFVVGASGTMYWRKAPDVFIRIADEIRRSAPDAPIYFVWVGGARAGDFVFFETNYDVEKLGLKSTVRFLEHKPNPNDYFAALDLFAMVSREDPFPLVCLEAAALGKPVVCFDKAGGMHEFVEEDAGFVVPYLDVEAFAGKILTLYGDRELSAKLGRNAARKVLERHNVETSAPRIVEIIKETGNFKDQ